jgi:hypothetical protein
VAITSIPIRNRIASVVSVDEWIQIVATPKPSSCLRKSYLLTYSSDPPVAGKQLDLIRWLARTPSTPRPSPSCTTSAPAPPSTTLTSAPLPRGPRRRPGAGAGHHEYRLVLLLHEEIQERPWQARRSQAASAPSPPATHAGTRRAAPRTSSKDRKARCATCPKGARTADMILQPGSGGAVHDGARRRHRRQRLCPVVQDLPVATCASEGVVLRVEDGQALIRIQAQGRR